MGLKQKFRKPIFTSILLSLAAVFLWSHSQIYLSVERFLLLVIVFLYIHGLVLTVNKIRREKLRWPLFCGGLALAYSALFPLFSEPMNNLLNYYPGAIAFVFGTAVISGGLEQIYRRESSLEAVIENKPILYSFIAGWLNLILGLCTYIVAFSPDYAITNVISVNFFSGILGSFLLEFLPTYLYLEKGQKIPLTGAIIWSSIGVFTFLGNMSSYPYSAFHQWTAFGLPLAGTYFFSGILFTSVLIIYENLRKND